MRILVLDPRLGTTSSELFVLRPDSGKIEWARELAYVPELRYCAPTGEVVLLETDVGPDEPVNYLCLWDGESLSEKLRLPIPPRPTYSGFAGRSVSGMVSASGRYVYFLRSGPIQRLDEYTLTFRIIPCRYDRLLREFEEAAFHVDSCHIDFGLTGVSEDELYLHLSCEFPSTLAFAGFSDPAFDQVRLVDLPGRVHGPLETNGSWLDPSSNRLFCVNRAGDLFVVDLVRRNARTLRSVAAGQDLAVPIHHICVAGNRVYVGRAQTIGEQGNGLASVVDCLDAESGELQGTVLLSQPAMNFAVSSEGPTLIAACPFQRCVFAQDLTTGDEIWRRSLGQTPGEILLLP